MHTHNVTHSPCKAKSVHQEKFNRMPCTAAYSTWDFTGQCGSKSHRQKVPQTCQLGRNTHARKCWAAWCITRLLVELTLKGVVLSFLSSARKSKLASLQLIVAAFKPLPDSLLCSNGPIACPAQTARALSDLYFLLGTFQLQCVHSAWLANLADTQGRTETPATQIDLPAQGSAAHITSA